MLRLFQPDVLDHLPAHQRRRSGRSGASRGSEINEGNSVYDRACTTDETCGQRQTCESIGKRGGGVGGERPVRREGTTKLISENN